MWISELSGALRSENGDHGDLQPPQKFSPHEGVPDVTFGRPEPSAPYCDRRLREYRAWRAPKDLVRAPTLNLYRAPSRVAVSSPLWPFGLDQV